jgi:hypothetical protein
VTWLIRPQIEPETVVSVQNLAPICWIIEVPSTTDRGADTKYCSLRAGRSNFAPLSMHGALRLHLHGWHHDELKSETSSTIPPLLKCLIPYLTWVPIQPLLVSLSVNLTYISFCNANHILLIKYGLSLFTKSKSKCRIN